MPSPLTRLALLALVLGLIGFMATRSALPQTGSDPLVTLPGHVPAALARATPVQPPAGTDVASQPITLSVVLNWRDPAGFQAFLANVENPQSSQYRHFLRQADLATRFGPAQQVYDAVIAYLHAFGFQLLEGSTNRLTVTVQGTRAQAERAFHVVLHDYQLGQTTFHANDTAPALPASVARSVQAVAGLSDLAQPRRAPVPRAAVADASATAPTPPLGSSIGTAYDAAGLGSGITGAGQKMGFVEFSTFNQQDVVTWLATMNLPASLINQLSVVNVNGGTTDPSGADEVLLDVDAALSLAPGASAVVYEAPTRNTLWQTLLNVMVGDGDTVISNSWDSCEAHDTAANVASIESILQSASASGVTIFTASGDSGNRCSSSDPVGSVSVPADAPHGTAVGGTRLLVGSSNAYASESYWVDRQGNPAGGYGVSMFLSRPAWQAGFTSASFRSIPDVAADADPSTGILVCDDTNGCTTLAGGTSLAAPIWASGLALINQKLGHLTGNLNPALYAQASTNAFHSAASIGSTFEQVGLGSFDLGNLANALSGAGVTTSGTVQQSGATTGATSENLTPTLSGSAPSAAGSGTTQSTVWLRQGGASGSATMRCSCAAHHACVSRSRSRRCIRSRSERRITASSMSSSVMEIPRPQCQAGCGSHRG
jgi:kumamolisin